MTQNNMIVTQSVTEIGTGLWVLLPKRLRDSLDIHKGDMVQIDIKKINLNSDDTEVMKKVICHECNHSYEMNIKKSKESFCPYCGLNYHNDNTNQTISQNV